MIRTLARTFLILSLVACGDKDDDTGSAATGACPSLCEGAGFSGGDEVDYGDNLIECTCEGSGDGIDAADCATYCEPFGVGADDALLSSQNSTNDKCVCDGTSG